MKKCLWLPDKNDRYFARKRMIISANTKLDFMKLKKGIEEGSLKTKENLKKYQLFSFLIFLLSIPNFLPLLIVKIMLSFFKDIIFYSSIKFSLGPFIFPIWWAFIFFISSIYFDLFSSIIICLSSVIALYFRQILLLYDK
jgi:hypothetical protein